MRKLLLIFSLIILLFAKSFACIVFPDNTVTITNSFPGNGYQIATATVNGVDSVVATIHSDTAWRSGSVFSACMPLTLKLAVGRIVADRDIQILRLDYQNASETWVTLKGVYYPSYSLSTEAFVPHFGFNCVNLSTYTDGDYLNLRIYFSDGYYEAYVYMYYKIWDNIRPY